MQHKAELLFSMKLWFMLHLITLSLVILRQHGKVYNRRKLCRADRLQDQAWE